MTNARSTHGRGGSCAWCRQGLALQQGGGTSLFCQAAEELSAARRHRRVSSVIMIRPIGERPCPKLLKRGGGGVRAQAGRGSAGSNSSIASRTRPTESSARAGLLYRRSMDIRSQGASVQAGMCCLAGSGGVQGAHQRASPSGRCRRVTVGCADDPQQTEQVLAGEVIERFGGGAATQGPRPGSVRSPSSAGTPRR